MRNPTASAAETRASIKTKYSGPTNSRGSTVYVTDGGYLGAMRVTWDDALNADQNMMTAAQMWLDRHNPKARVKSPGLSFDGFTLWTWEHKS